MKQTLIHTQLKWGEKPDLLQLTYHAHRAILDQLEEMIALTHEHRGDPAKQADYAVLTGIQIHGPKSINWVWPGKCYSVVDGVEEPLDLHRLHDWNFE